MVRSPKTENKGRPVRRQPTENGQNRISEAPADQPRIIATPGICGGSARIHGTRIPVWGLEWGRRVGRSDKNLLRAYPSLTAADLEAAWRYVEAHPEEIEAEIRENNQ